MLTLNPHCVTSTSPFVSWFTTDGHPVKLSHGDAVLHGAGGGGVSGRSNHLEKNREGTRRQTVPRRNLHATFATVICRHQLPLDKFFKHGMSESAVIPEDALFLGMMDV